MLHNYASWGGLRRLLKRSDFDQSFLVKMGKNLDKIWGHQCIISSMHRWGSDMFYNYAPWSDLEAY